MRCWRTEWGRRGSWRTETALWPWFPYMYLCLSLATAATWCGRARRCTCTSLPTAWSRSKSSQHQRPSEIDSLPPSAKHLWMPPPKSGGPLQFDLCCVQRCSSVLWSVSLTLLFFPLTNYFAESTGRRFSADLPLIRDSGLFWPTFQKRTESIWKR